jgi:hypothetical protein
MEKLNLIKELYTNLSKRGKLCVWLGGLIVAIVVLEVVKGCSG